MLIHIVPFFVLETWFSGSCIGGHSVAIVSTLGLPHPALVCSSPRLTDPTLLCNIRHMCCSIGPAFQTVDSSLLCVVKMIRNALQVFFVRWNI